MDLVDAGRDLKVTFTSRGGLVVNGRASNSEELTLPSDRQVFFFVDQGPPRYWI